MTDQEKVIECLEKSKMVIEKWVPMFEQYNTPSGIDDAIVLLKEQERRINELEEKLRLLQYGDQDILQSGMMPAT